MSSRRLAIPDLGRIFQGESISGLSEWQLLERYLERRDESAFEALVTRHGPMVLGVCRRMLGGSSEAEDAFQATFLVLVRRARDLGPRDAIGPWLYGVATRVAARARRQASRRRRERLISTDLPIMDRSGSTVDPDLAEVIDDELSRLPAKYRSPLVLCYLEGRTHEEAARDLHWALGTVKGRLARARELLRSRLARRGFAPTAGVLGVLSSPDLRALLDQPLVERTVGAAVKLAAGQTVAQVVSQTITSLVEGALGTMFWNKMKWAALAVVTSGFAFTSAVVLGRQDLQPGGDVQKVYKKKLPSAPPGTSETQKVFEQKGLAPAPAQAKIVTDNELGGFGTGVPPAADDARTNDPRSRQILAKLDEPISMSFANETPLDDVLKYIKQASTTKTFSGIPIYVDPQGLQEAERSLNSTVQIDLEGVPLRRTLQLILTQLRLAYFVEDGFLVITSEELAKDHLPPPMPTPAPINQMFEKAERGEMSSSELKELVEVIKLRRQIKLMRENYDAPAPGSKPIGGGLGEGDSRGFPGEENVSETRELLKEVRELIRLLKAEKEPKKPAEATKK